MSAHENNIIQQFQNILGTDTQPAIDAVRQEIESLVPQALAVCRDFLSCDEASMDQKFKVAKYILDISSIGTELAKAKSPHVSTLIQNCSPEQLADLRKTADRLIVSLRQKKKA